MPYVTQVTMPMELYDRIRTYQGSKSFSALCREALTEWVERHEWADKRESTPLSPEAEKWMETSMGKVD